MKKGDKVICVSKKGENGLFYGEEYTVSKDTGEKITVKELKGARFAFRFIDKKLFNNQVCERPHNATKRSSSRSDEDQDNVIHGDDNMGYMLPR